jgi:hypothetical protein
MVEDYHDSVEKIIGPSIALRSIVGTSCGPVAEPNWGVAPPEWAPPEYGYRPRPFYEPSDYGYPRAPVPVAQAGTLGFTRAFNSCPATPPNSPR